MGHMRSLTGDRIGCTSKGVLPEFSDFWLVCDHPCIHSTGSQGPHSRAPQSMTVDLQVRS